MVGTLWNEIDGAYQEVVDTCMDTFDDDFVHGIDS